MDTGGDSVPYAILALPVDFAGSTECCCSRSQLDRCVASRKLRPHVPARSRDAVWQRCSHRNDVMHVPNAVGGCRGRPGPWKRRGGGGGHPSMSGIARASPSRRSTATTPQPRQLPYGTSPMQGKLAQAHAMRSPARPSFVDSESRRWRNTGIIPSFSASPDAPFCSLHTLHTLSELRELTPHF